MCGIAGIVKLDPRETVEEARLKRMRDALRHRGPDGEGLYVDGPVGLGHRRLAIIDLSAAGQQPTIEHLPIQHSWTVVSWPPATGFLTAVTS